MRVADASSLGANPGDVETPNESRRSADPIVMLLDSPADRGRNKNGAPADNPVIYLGVVRDPAKLMSGRKARFHDDVVEALTDLLLEWVDKDGCNGTDSSDR
jgi:hypothetical protein